MNELQQFTNGSFNLPVRQLADGSIEFDVEHAAIGLGISFVAKSGNEVVRWSRVNEYLGFATSGKKISRGDFITEPQFYKLAIKANNEKAEHFQDWVTNDVLPSIRKNGMYATPQAAADLLQNPTTLIKLLQNYADTQAQLEQEHSQRLEVEDELSVAQPKADYTDAVLSSKGAMSITVIAKEYGMSAVKMNKVLHNMGVQFETNGVWVLYAKYADKGYTKVDTIPFTRNDGRDDFKLHMKWTQKGRKFLYDFLKERGILPIAEQQELGMEAM